MLVLLLLALLALGADYPPMARVVAPEPPADGEPVPPGIPDPPIAWRASKALGLPYSGGVLIRGVQLPEQGRDYFTWDPILKVSPNRPGRRWGTDALVRTLLAVLRDFHAAHPDRARVGVGDLSRPRGGAFGRRYGGLGHASHQNGLDVDVYYPRFDGLELRAYEPELVDIELAQELVDRFVDAGAQRVFVGPSLNLLGPRGIVTPLVHHDDHMHVRLPPPPE